MKSLLFDYFDSVYIGRLLKLNIKNTIQMRETKKKFRLQLRQPTCNI